MSDWTSNTDLLEFPVQVDNLEVFRSPVLRLQGVAPEDLEVGLYDYSCRYQ